MGLNSGTEIPCKLGAIVPSWTASINLNGSTSTPEIIQGGSTMMPSACYCIRSTYINDFLVENGYYSSFTPTYNTNDQELQSITQSGFASEVQAVNNATTAINNVDSSVQDVNSSVQDVNSSVQQVDQSVQEMIEQIVAPYVNVSQEQLPTQEVNDTTQDPLNTLFDYIKDAFTGEPQGFTIPLPFVRC